LLFAQQTKNRPKSLTIDRYGYDGDDGDAEDVLAAWLWNFVAT